MDSEEKAILHKMIHCLERIAYNTSAGNLEFDAWKEIHYRDFPVEEITNASSEQVPTEILRDVRTQPETRDGEVSGHEQGQDVGVRINPDQGLAKQGKRLWFPKK